MKRSVSPHRALQISFFLLLPLLVCSCVRAGPGEVVWMEPGLPLVVENHAWQDVDVYLERDGARFRLGFVMSQDTEPLRIRPWMLGSAPKFQLTAEAVGSRDRFESGTILARRDVVTCWTLEPTTWMSFLEFR
jgi:hypothetical protein